MMEYSGDFHFSLSLFTFQGGQGNARETPLCSFLPQEGGHSEQRFSKGIFEVALMGSAISALLHSFLCYVCQVGQ